MLKQSMNCAPRDWVSYLAMPPNGRFSITHIEKATDLIISTSSVETQPVIQAARELNPKIRILTRAKYLRESTALRDAGANAVFSSEGEIALSMSAFLVRQLRASDEQIDRERRRVRADLFPFIDTNLHPVG